MAAQDLQTFLEDRLRALVPTIDLDAGSPAQTQFIAPLLSYLGTDPFETDISAFIGDRFTQEFPNIAVDLGAVQDVFVKPLILMLTPFKREINLIRQGQSLEDPSVLSDDDADALAANFYESRDSGGFAVGVGRLFFSNPTNVQVEITSRFFTSSGLNYFPTAPMSITAEQMVFNRSGALYFMDVPLQADKVGASYNIDVGQLTGVDGIFGQVKVANLRKFRDGTETVDTPTFVAQTGEALTERSLVNRRGATARINDVFKGEVAAIQVIGASDPEMRRDILVATSPGHAFLQGQVAIYQQIAFVQCRVVDGSITDAPVPGDQLYIYLDKYSNSGIWSSLDQSKRFVRFTVEEVYQGPLVETTPPFQESFLVRISGSVPQGVTLPNPVVVEGGFSKKGTVQISSLPDFGAVDLVVSNQDVHVFGHTDFYVRPVLQTVSTTLISNLVDDPVDLSLQQLTGSTISGSNLFTDSGGLDFGQQGVLPGDLLTLETGTEIGTYIVGAVNGVDIYLTVKLTATAGNLRYRITKSISIDPFEPKVPKLPFGSLPNNDLATEIGSPQLSFTTTDLLSFGAAAGDTVRIVNGPDAGDFSIVSFVSGKEVVVDRPLSSSASGLTFEVFTKLSPVLLPLVRVREIQLLDSSQQSTGVQIPYGAPVACVPTCDFTGAQVKGGSQRKSGFVLPALTKPDGSDDYVTGGNVAAVSGDRRYSLGFDPFTGTYKAMLFPNSAQAEFDFVSDADKVCSYFLAASEDTTQATNFPPVDPKPGDALTLKSGPNKGSYLIQSVIKFKYQTVSGNVVWLYFIKIYGSFPVDTLRSIIEFLDGNGSPVTKVTNGSGTIAFPDFFVNSYNGLGAQMNTALLSKGASSPGASALQAMINNSCQVDYEWGDPARGVIRTYFAQPALFQQHTALNPQPTIYELLTADGTLLKFRPDPDYYIKQEIIPPRLSSDSDPLDYPRDLLATSPSNPSFTDTTQPSVLEGGIQVGDILSVHQEVFFHGSSKLRQTAVGTTQGSNVVTAPATASGGIFTAGMIGNLVFIDETTDKGGYKIVDVPDAFTLLLDHAFQNSTPAIQQQGNSAKWGYDGAIDKITTPAPAGFTGALVNKWLTVYGIDYHYEGSYKILAAPDSSTLSIDRGALGHWPSYGPSLAEARWVITDAPAVAPVNDTVTSSEMTGLRPIRMYASVTNDLPVTVVSLDPSNSNLTVSGTIEDGLSQPYRIYRNNIRRVTPTEISLHQDGPLFYFDTQVISMGPETAFNIQEESYLTPVDGTFECYGYLHKVDDNTLSYSTKESGRIDMPAQILPIGSADSPVNMLNLVGTPIEVDYEQSDLVKQLQEFIDSADDRVTSANLLGRHFLPSYISYDASYSGGSAPSVIAADIISYINSLAVQTPIEVSRLEKAIDDRGGDPVVPTKVIAVLHDWDRKLWAEFGKTRLGGTTTLVPYNGTPRVSYFVPGPDVSGDTTLPAGERIDLTQT